jgi:hypothetical protein
LANLGWHFPQSKELQGIFPAPTVFNEIYDAKGTLSKGLPDTISVVNDVSWPKVASVYDLIGAHAD